MITLEELKNDANFIETPAAIYQHIEAHAGSYHQYVSYLQFFGDDPVVRTFAFKRFKKETCWTEVERRTLRDSVRRNLYFTQMGGYHPVYGVRNIKSNSWQYYGYHYYYFEESDWNRWGYERPIHVNSQIINLNKLFQEDKYQYCGYSTECGDLLDYLEAYNKEPLVEHFGKMGLQPKSSLVKQCKKDKQFCRYLITHTQEIKADWFGPQEVLYAYKNNKSLKESRAYLSYKHLVERETRGWENIKTVDRMRVYEFAVGVGLYNYRDYWRAINAIGLDLNDTKNIYPKDFKRMHDLRTQEYASIKAKENEMKKKQLSDEIAKAAGKYLTALIENEKYCILLPDKVEDFIREGELLHHCVGVMGYDKKMAQGKCVIAFIREKGSADTPYVTVEFSLNTKSIAQIYGDHDSKPKEDVIKFSKQWEHRMQALLKTA